MKFKVKAIAVAGTVSATALTGMGGSAHATTSAVYEWHNRASGLCLSNSNGVGLPSGAVQVAACDSPTDSYLNWAQYPNSGAFVLKDTGSGNYLCQWTGSQYDACPSGQVYQEVLEPGGYYWFRNAVTGFCLADQGSSLHPNTCDTADPSSNPGAEWFHTP